MAGGSKTFKQAARWLRSRLVRGALILGYHRVAGPGHDPYGMCVTPRRFAEQLAVLHRSACLLSLAELVQRMEQGKLPPRAVALTFDDGYADNLYQARPLLEQYEIPATFFVTTGYLGREFWWDELEQIIFSPTKLPPQLGLSVDGRVFEWTVNTPERSRHPQSAANPRSHLLHTLFAYLLPLGAEQQQQVLTQLHAWSDVAAETRADHRALRPQEVGQLAESELVEIGAHTVTHPVLARLPAVRQQEEITQSKHCLEQLVGRPVTSFSYPNGSATVPTRLLAREAGFTRACASHNDIARRGSDPLCLPRFWVPDWDGARFGRWLRRWLHG